MFNVKKLVSFTLCGLVVFGLGACSAGDDSSATGKKAWYPPSSTPDASATPTDDASPVVGPDPANPHLIPRPFVNADGSLNPPTEPDLTDHSEQGVRKASEFFMQAREYLRQTGDVDFFAKYIDPESYTGNLAMEPSTPSSEEGNSSDYFFIEDFEYVLAGDEKISGYFETKGYAKVYIENETSFRTIVFNVLLGKNPETGKWWIREMVTGTKI